MHVHAIGYERERIDVSPLHCGRIVPNHHPRAFQFVWPPMKFFPEASLTMYSSFVNRCILSPLSGSISPIKPTSPDCSSDKPLASSIPVTFHVPCASLAFEFCTVVPSPQLMMQQAINALKADASCFNRGKVNMVCARFACSCILKVSHSIRVLPMKPHSNLHLLFQAFQTTCS